MGTEGTICVKKTTKKERAIGLNTKYIVYIHEKSQWNSILNS